jgi:hypothetical protein
MAPRWQFGWIYVARLRKTKKERRGNFLLYAKAAAVSKQ